MRHDPNALRREDLQSWSGRFGHRGAVVFAPEPSALNVAGAEHACSLVAAFCSFAASRGDAVRMISRHARDGASDPLHNWSPIHLPMTAAQGSVPKGRRVLYLSFAHLQGVLSVDRAARKVTVLAGTPLGALVRLLSDPTAAQIRPLWLCPRPAELGRWTLPVIPAPGVISIGGCLAVGAHGTGTRGLDGGDAPGSVSATVAGARVLRWDRGARHFVIHEVREGDPELAAVSANLGRIPVLTVTLDIVPDRPQRVHLIRAARAELRGRDPAARGSFAALAERYPGGVEAILFRPTEQLPAAKQADGYALAWESGGAEVALPAFSTSPTAHERFTHLGDVEAGLTLAGSRHLIARQAEKRARKRHASWELPWLTSGRARNYVTSDTMRVEPFSYAIVAPAGEVQEVVWAFHRSVDEHLRPNDGAFERHCVATEIRFTPVDRPRGLRRAPLLACTTAPPGGGDGERRVVWVTVLAATDQKSMRRGRTFFARLERTLEEVAQAHGWSLRPEWSKCWGFATDGAWSRDAVTLRGALVRGYGGALAEAKAIFDELDPGRVFAAPLHKKIGLA
ncbi:MAG: hypothetical protein H6711_31460 [Myxococcales bacterium]|nr:hypothetical protein [Myxococcales bacterium]